MNPIRPNMISRTVAPVQASDEGWESLSDSHVIPAATGHGGEVEADIVNADDDVVIQHAKPMPAPILPSKAVIEAHNLTHWPYRDWCPHCVASRRPNSTSPPGKFVDSSNSAIASCRLLLLKRFRRPATSQSFSGED